MPIISLEIKKTIDQREMQKTTKEKQRKTERSKGNRNYSERVRAKWFCCAFKLGFLQSVCKASLIFNSNLELALSIILKQRESYESKHVAVECRCLKLRMFVSQIVSQNWFSFLSQIKNANLSKKFLVSYNVTSLFTNIPLQETIDIAINLIFNHNSNLNIT